MNIKHSFNSKKVRNMENLDNVYVCGPPFVMIRNDAQNVLGISFNSDHEVEKYCKRSPHTVFTQFNSCIRIEH